MVPLCLRTALRQNLRCPQQSGLRDLFDIAHNARLLYSGSSLGGAELFECSFEAMKDYILHRGHHPCLEDCQPDSAARL